MAGSMKSLAKDTAIYGLSSIVGRFLNWLLTPLYLYIFTDTIEYGKVSAVYGYTALFMVLLTYGMETGFFRFMNKKGENPSTVYSTSLISLATTSVAFVIFCFAFITPISEWMEYRQNPDHILIMAITVAIDAFMVVPYAYLRYQKRPMRFAMVRLGFVFFSILLNLFFLVLCPILYKSYPSLIEWFYDPDYGIGYIFVANLISTALVLLLLTPQIKESKWKFDVRLLSSILKYSFPLLILGIAGVVNQTVAQLVYPHLFSNPQEAFSQLGIYNACLKITVIITMFTQAFRYAYEPFIFAENKGGDNKKSYAEATKYFVIFALLVFVGVMFYLDDLIIYLVSDNYREGINVVPIAMMGEIFFGIYFNLSVWYKLTDKTSYGAVFSIVGCIITVAINVVFVPLYGFIASAWATFVCNIIIMTASYICGQKYYPIKYDLKTIFFYFVIAICFFVAGVYINIENVYLRLTYRTALLLIFAAIVVKRDIPLSTLPYIGKYFSKK